MIPRRLRDRVGCSHLCPILCSDLQQSLARTLRVKSSDSFALHEDVRFDLRRFDTKFVVGRSFRNANPPTVTAQPICLGAPDEPETAPTLQMSDGRNRVLAPI